MSACIHGTANLTRALLVTDTVQTEEGYVDHGYGYTSPTYRDRCEARPPTCQQAHLRSTRAGLLARALRFERRVTLGTPQRCDL